jgi:hypothetical protein
MMALAYAAYGLMQTKIVKLMQATNRTHTRTFSMTRYGGRLYSFGFPKVFFYSASANATTTFQGCT